jgi:hypothetical protein
MSNIMRALALIENLWDTLEEKRDFESIEAMLRTIAPTVEPSMWSAFAQLNYLQIVLRENNLMTDPNHVNAMLLQTYFPHAGLKMTEISQMDSRAIAEGNVEAELRQAICNDMMELEQAPHKENAEIRAKIQAENNIQTLPSGVFMDKQAADYICNKLNTVMQRYAQENQKMVDMVSEMGQMQEALDKVKAASWRFLSK